MGRASTGRLPASEGHLGAQARGGRTCIQAAGAGPRSDPVARAPGGTPGDRGRGGAAAAVLRVPGKAFHPAPRSSGLLAAHLLLPGEKPPGPACPSVESVRDGWRPLRGRSSIGMDVRAGHAPVDRPSVWTGRTAHGGPPARAGRAGRVLVRAERGAGPAGGDAWRAGPGRPPGLLQAGAVPAVPRFAGLDRGDPGGVFEVRQGAVVEEARGLGPGDRAVLGTACRIPLRPRHGGRNGGGGRLPDRGHGSGGSIGEDRPANHAPIAGVAPGVAAPGEPGLPPASSGLSPGDQLPDRSR